MANLRRLAAVLCSAGVLISGVAATSAAEELVVVSTGGSFGAALKKIFFDPFTAETGIEIIHVPATVQQQNGKLRAMLKADNVEYDVLTTTDDAVIGDAEVYQELDCAKVPNAAQYGVPGTCSGRSLLRTAGASMLVYKTDAFPAGGPRTWSDFWNIERFPGARCLIGGTTENHIPLLAALSADGVPPEELFPIDMDRAVRKLEELKPHVAAYWSSYSQSQQLLRDGECVASIMTNGRAMSLRNEGFPLTLVWQGAFSNSAGWGIAAKAPNREAAYKFLDYWMKRPEAHLAFYRKFFYGTANRDVLKLLSAEEQADYYAHPENFVGQIALDTKWIGENLDTIRRRYADFLSR